MSSDIEIARFHHRDPLVLAQKVLSDAGLPFRTSDDSLTLDVAALGSGSQASSILLVPSNQALAAWSALLEEARKEVAAAPDNSHFLASYPDQELLEVITQPKDWSEYDIALAEHFLRVRGLTPPPVDFSSRLPPPSDPTRGGSRELAAAEPAAGTKEASRAMLLGGFLFGSLGGCWGFIISLALLISTETGPDGRKRYVYSPRTRKLGFILFLYSFLIFWGLYLLAYYFAD